MITYQSYNGKPVSPLIKFFFARIFPWPFIIVGGFILFFGVRNMIHARASTLWPTVSGVVRESSVESQFGSKGSTTYNARVWYEYNVDQIKHSGNRIAYGDDDTSDPAHAQNIVNRYPPGMGVTVHYLSSNPDESVLEPGIKTRTWMLAVFGFVFVAWGLLMVVILPRAFRNY